MSARPVLEKLREDTGETAALFVLREQKRICVLELESHHALTIARGIGDTGDITLGASGKAILAYLDEKRRDAILDQVTTGPPRRAHQGAGGRAQPRLCRQPWRSLCRRGRARRSDLQPQRRSRRMPRRVRSKSPRQGHGYPAVRRAGDQGGQRCLRAIWLSRPRIAGGKPPKPRPDRKTRGAA